MPAAATTQFTSVMDDDFNTPEALAVLQGLAGEINRARDAGDTARAAQAARELIDLGRVLGILTLEPADWFRLPKARLESESGGGDKSMGPEMVEMLIAERRAARLAKNYKRSDEIRKQISDAGIILEDKPDGTTIWRYS